MQLNRPTRSAVLGSVLIMLIVLTGCSAFPFDEDRATARTVTPAPVPTDRPTATPVLMVAPGVSATGIENPTALVDAHAALLDNISYTVHTRNVERYVNGTLRRRTTTHARFGANRSR